MRKIICSFLFLFLSLTATIRAWEGNVLISTPNSSIVLGSSGGDQLRFSYFGSRNEENQINQIYDAWDGLGRPAYPVFGTSNRELSALQAVHADGNQTLDLGVESVEQTPVKDAVLTVITLKDRFYPFTVKLNYKAYQNFDMIETWTEIFHTEKKAVVLKRFDSGHFSIRRGDVWVSYQVIGELRHKS